jgi:hypothetical protein
MTIIKFEFSKMLSLCDTTCTILSHLHVLYSVHTIYTVHGTYSTCSLFPCFCCLSDVEVSSSASVQTRSDFTSCISCSPCTIVGATVITETRVNFHILPFSIFGFWPILLQTPHPARGTRKTRVFKTYHIPSINL